MHCGGSKPHAVDSCERLVGELKQDDLGESVEAGCHGGHQHVGGHAVQAEVDDAEQDLLLTRCIEESIKTFSTHVECWFYLDSAACEGRGRVAEEDTRGRHQRARTHAQEYPETSPEQLRISEETIKYRLD